VEMQQYTVPAMEHSMLVVIDVQDRLCRAMPSACAERLTMMAKAVRIAGILKIETVVTEQYPQGLGTTVPELRDALEPGMPVFEKTAFSCWGCGAFAAAVDAHRPQALVLLGMETHVCVQQTALAALARGYGVFLLADAVCSRRDADRDTALALLRDQGAIVTTVEALAFAWLQTAAHPKFREVSRVVK